jgi:hypothetical protein
MLWENTDKSNGTFRLQIISSLQTLWSLTNSHQQMHICLCAFVGVN